MHRPIQNLACIPSFNSPPQSPPEPQRAFELPSPPADSTLIPSISIPFNSQKTPPQDSSPAPAPKDNAPQSRPVPTLSTNPHPPLDVARKTSHSSRISPQYFTIPPPQFPFHIYRLNIPSPYPYLLPFSFLSPPSPQFPALRFPPPNSPPPNFPPAHINHSILRTTPPITASPAISIMIYIQL